MKIYTQDEIQNELIGWAYNDKCIHKDFQFSDFKDAFAFMVKVAFHAEILDHHPDWTNVYNKVSFKLNTHSKGEVTEKDVELAKIIDKIV